jgi:hypothetical protein
MSAAAPQPAPSHLTGSPRLLAAFVVAATIALAVALVTGATGIFNALVFMLFAVLWISFAAALAMRPAELDDLWGAYRRRSALAQALGWLLFLPLVLALFVWERRWHPGVRLLLVLAIATANLFMFFPRG